MNVLGGYLVTLGGSDEVVFFYSTLKIYTILYSLLTDEMYVFRKLLADGFPHLNSISKSFIESIGVGDILFLVKQFSSYEKVAEL